MKAPELKLIRLMIRTTLRFGAWCEEKFTQIVILIIESARQLEMPRKKGSRSFSVRREGKAAISTYTKVVEETQSQ